MSILGNFFSRLWKWPARADRRRPPARPQLLQLEERETPSATTFSVASQIIDSNEFRVRLVQSVYQQFLGRAADPGGLQYSLNQLTSGNNGVNSNGLTPAQFEASILGSQEFQAGHGSGSAFVNAAYQAILGRSADAGGLAFYTGQLNGGTSAQTVALEILNSTEAVTQRVTGYYEEFLGRAPDAGGLANFTNMIVSGVNPAGNGGTGPGSNTGSSDTFVEAAIAGSDEYAAHFAGNNTALVNSLYLQLLGRPATGDPGAQGFVNQLNGGSSTGGTNVSASVAESNDSNAQNPTAPGTTVSPTVATVGGTPNGTMSIPANNDSSAKNPTTPGTTTSPTTDMSGYNVAENNDSNAENPTTPPTTSS